MKYLSKLKPGLSVEDAGNKAFSLVFLKKNKYHIPDTYIVLSSAFEQYKIKPEEVIASLQEEVKILPDKNFIVRSSTNLEDSDKFSHAGQFLSIPDIRGAEELVSAVRSIWDAALNHDNNEYLKRISQESSSLKCAVIIQLMVNPVLTGVSFSKNPLTGVDDVVIEAVEGSGENLMQNGVTPMRWTVRDNNIDDSDGDRGYRKIISKVSKTTRNIYRRYNRHIDIEWVYDGRKIFYVQLRNITGASEVNVYSNKMAQEMLPGMIKPLVWSVNINMVNSTWIGLLSKITGPLDVKPEDLARSFYYRTYFNVHELGKIFNKFGVPFKSLEDTHTSDNQTKHSFKPGLKTIRHSFRIIKFIFSIINFESFYKKEYSELEKEYKIVREQLDKGTDRDNFERIFNKMMMLGKRLTYLNIIMPLLMRVYNKRLHKKLEKAGINYETIDFNLDFPELLEYSPYTRIEKIKAMIDESVGDGIKQISSYSELVQSESAKDIVNEIDKLINKFGHFSESGNDMSYSKWEEDPEYVFSMIMDYSEPKRTRSTHSFYDIISPGTGKRRLRKSYAKAGRYKVYREQISSFYIYGYGLFRKLFLQIADILVNDGVIKERNDIFYLGKSEIDRILVSSDKVYLNNIPAIVEKTKKEMDEGSDIILPAVIYGDEAPILEYKDIVNYAGVSASSGQYSGIARVIKEAKDFDKVNHGDIIIIPFSDVSWTPILCKAGAIVSESGGILSHCSIIAREMGIPAIVSVDNACAIKDDIYVTVDGSNGILTIHNKN